MIYYKSFHKELSDLMYYITFKLLKRETKVVDREKLIRLTLN